MPNSLRPRPSSPTLSYSTIFDDIRPRTASARPRSPLPRVRPKTRAKESSSNSEVETDVIDDTAGSNVKSNTSWQDATISLASNVQDNLLEEVYRLQTALDAANAKVATANIQIDLLQRDFEDAQEAIATQEDACKKLKLESVAKCKESSQQLTDLMDRNQALQSKLDAAKSLEAKHEKKIALQKQEIEFLEEFQYQLEGDLRELKSELESKDQQVKAMKLRHTQHDASLLQHDEAMIKQIKAYQSLQEHVDMLEKSLANGPVLQNADDKRDRTLSLYGKRSSMLSTSGTDMNLHAWHRARLSCKSQNSTDSVATVNSIATSGLERDALEWIRDTAVDEQVIVRKSLEDELAEDNQSQDLAETGVAFVEPESDTEMPVPDIRVRAAAVTSEQQQEEKQQQRQKQHEPMKDSSTFSTIATQTDTFPETPTICSSKHVQTEADHATCVPAAFMSRLRETHKSDLQELHKQYRKDHDQLKQSIDDLETACDTLQSGRQFKPRGAPRTSHLFEVKDRFGNTEIKFQRVTDGPARQDDSQVALLSAQNPRLTLIDTGHKSSIGHGDQNHGSARLLEPQIYLQAPDSDSDSDDAANEQNAIVCQPSRLTRMNSFSTIPIPVRRESLLNEFTPAKVLDLRLRLSDEHSESVRPQSSRLAIAPNPWADMTNEGRPLRMFGPRSDAQQTSDGRYLETPDASRRPHTTGSGFSNDTSLMLDSSPPQMPEPTAAEILGQKMTRTLIGTEMFKYIRQNRSLGIWGGARRREEESVHRHKRYVMLRPQEGTICWSSSRPAGKVLGFKKCYIHEVHDVEDNAPAPPGIALHNRSLLVISEGQSLRFTAINAEIHETWVEVIVHMLRERRANLSAPSLCTISSLNLSSARQSPIQRSNVESRAGTARPRPIMRNRPSMPDLQSKSSSRTSSRPNISHPFNMSKSNSSESFKSDILSSDTALKPYGSNSQFKAPSFTLQAPSPIKKKNSSESQQRVLAAFAD